MTRRIRRILAVTVLVVCAAAPARAQKYQFLGRGKCVNCHDHDNEKLWSEKKDGPPPNNHLNALKQMENQKSQAFADATGVKDVYDPGSPCVACHATVVKGDTAGGVTCESCHGPGSAYNEPHQKKDTGYAASIALGLNDFVKKPQNWAGTCMKCHVMDDARLIAAKHPPGDDFDLGAKFQIVATGHWKSTYDKAAITAGGRAAAAPLLAKRGGRVVPPVAAPPAVAPQVTTLPTGPARANVPPAVAAAPSTPVAPGPTTVTRSAAPPTPVAPGQTTVTRSPAPPAAPPPRPTAPIGLPPTPKVTPPPPATTEASAVVPPPALPQSPTAAVAEVQGRAITLIDSLLRRGGRAPIRVTPPERKMQYNGADADLLRLQEEVLALAIEALGTAPPAPAKK